LRPSTKRAEGESPDARLHVYDEGHLGILTIVLELAGKVSDFLTAR